MKIATLIRDESHRFQAFYGVKPTLVFIGTRQAAEIDAMVAGLREMGLLMEGAPLSPRARIDGMDVFRVDADSHLSFGVEQPSPCG